MLWVFGIYDLFSNGILVRLASRFSQNGEYEALLYGLGFAAVVLVSYLLGNLNFALIISKLCYKDDVRTHGSGNAGTTNVLRTYGKGAAIATFAGDSIKGVLAVVFAGLVFGGIPFHVVVASYLAAFFAVLGHVFPFAAHFHGGKGFATTAGCILALNPVIFVILAIIFFTIVFGTKYVSLGSVVVALFYPILLGSFDTAFTQYGMNVIIAFLMGALVTWCHRGNISRLMHGTERKIVLGKPKPPKDGGNEA